MCVCGARVCWCACMCVCVCVRIHTYQWIDLDVFGERIACIFLPTCCWCVVGYGRTLAQPQACTYTHVRSPYRHHIITLARIQARNEKVIYTSRHSVSSSLSLSFSAVRAPRWSGTLIHGDTRAKSSPQQCCLSTALELTPHTIISSFIFKVELWGAHTNARSADIVACKNP